MVTGPTCIYALSKSIAVWQTHGCHVELLGHRAHSQQMLAGVFTCRPGSSESVVECVTCALFDCPALTSLLSFLQVMQAGQAET
jgi:hypothetical protein